MRCQGVEEKREYFAFQTSICNIPTSPLVLGTSLALFPTMKTAAKLPVLISTFPHCPWLFLYYCEIRK